jgi:succinoglycan biosynthesis protein ExoA
MTPISVEGVSHLSKVSVIVPSRNEIDFIGAFVKSLLNQDLTGIELEIVIADGMSDDGTLEELTTLAQMHTEIAVIPNPEKIVSTGLNRAIRTAQGDIIIRMDCHSSYARDYIRQCVAVLEGSGAANVGGPWIAAGESYIERAIAVAFQSPFSSGGARSHSPWYEGEVDSVYLGCWRKSVLIEAGMFDESLVRNQDDELNLRLRRRGQRIWQSPSIKSEYHVRSSLKSLFRQYSQYGFWKVRVLQKHHIPASPRHLAPGAFVITLLLLATFAPFFPVLKSWLWSLLAVYGLVSIGSSVAVCRRKNSVRLLPVMPLIFMTYHFGYGYGYVRGLINFLSAGHRTPANFSQITRTKPTTTPVRGQSKAS